MAITGYRIFELRAVGRDHAVEVTEEGCVPVSPDGTILDATPASEELLAIESGTTAVRTDS